MLFLIDFRLVILAFSFAEVALVLFRLLSPLVPHQGEEMQNRTSIPFRRIPTTTRTQISLVMLVPDVRQMVDAHSYMEESCRG